MRWRSRRRSTTTDDLRRDDPDAQREAEQAGHRPTGAPTTRTVRPPWSSNTAGTEPRSAAHEDEERAAAWLQAVADATAEHQWAPPEATGPTQAPAAPPPPGGSGPEVAPPAPPPGPSAPTSPPVVDPAAWAAAARDVVRRALDEDLDVTGDVTAQATVPPDAVGVGRVVARAEGVLAGLALVAEVYEQLDPRIEVRTTAHDGEAIRAGQVLAEVRGPLRSVLTGERTALNLLTHLSGVATLTATYVRAVAATGCEVRDTRKTTPGLRLLEKEAVHAGGGGNHRLGLSDALLVKDNHIAAAGDVATATRQAVAGARGLPVQVEVESLAELDEAVAAGARDLLLDNFDVEETRRAVARVRELEADHGRILLESSGGLDLEVVRGYAQAGVDRVAVGALTHSAPQLDLALEVEPAAPRSPDGPDQPSRSEELFGGGPS